MNQEYAFPQSLQAGNLANSTGGLMLRDYFIANAPAEPQPWFHPVMISERPVFPELPDDMSAAEKEDWRAYREEYASLCMPRLIAYEAQKTQASKDGAAWDREYTKQLYIQWPAAWADAMLAERAKGGEA